MIKPNKAMRDAIKVTVHGAGTVLFSTVASCAFAVVIERTAHRTLYRFFPHLYKDVAYANGLPHLQYQIRNSQVAEENRVITPKEETYGTDNLTDTNAELDSSFTASIISIKSALYQIRESSTKTGTSTRDDEPFYVDEQFRNSEKSSQIENNTNVMNEKSERLSIHPDQISKIVQSCAMTAG